MTYRITEKSENLRNLSAQVAQEAFAQLIALEPRLLDLDYATWRGLYDAICVRLLAREPDPAPFHQPSLPPKRQA